MPYSVYKKSKIHFTETGSGACVVLLHGFLETTSMWQFALPELSKRYRVICIDLPGHGNSECLAYVHTMEEMARCVEAVLHGVGVRKCRLIGHSMGGYVALAFADLFPDKVKGLSLFFSTSRADSKQKKHDRNRAIEVVKKNHKSFIRAAFPMLFRAKYRSAKKDQIKAAKVEAMKTSKQGIIATLEGMKKRPSREMLLKFPPYPIHIIAGQRDPVIPVETLLEQMNISDGVSGKVLKEPGHMGHIEAPQECLLEILSFLRRT